VAAAAASFPFLVLHTCRSQIAAAGDTARDQARAGFAGDVGARESAGGGDGLAGTEAVVVVASMMEDEMGGAEGMRARVRYRCRLDLIWSRRCMEAC
jgi:hypothetical protein